MRRLIGIEAEIIQCGPPYRIGVLILGKCLTVPGYRIGRLSHSPGNATIALVHKRAVV